MAARVDRLQPAVLDVGVDLRRADAGVAEHLLQGANLRSARMYSPFPATQPPNDRGREHRTSRLAKARSLSEYSVFLPLVVASLLTTIQPLVDFVNTWTDS